MFLKYVTAHDLCHMMDILRFIARIHASNSISTSRYQAMCMSYAKISQLLIKWIPIAYLVSASLYITTALFESLASGVLKPPIQLYLPNIDGHIGTEADLLTCAINILAIFFLSFTLGIYVALILLTFFNVHPRSLLLK